MTVPDLSSLICQLEHGLTRDVHALRTRLHGLKKRAAKGLPTDKGLAEISAQIAASTQTVAMRRALVPKIQYPEDLPVVLRREEILAALAKNQVLILCGETGSGKTTSCRNWRWKLGAGCVG